jgi:hypothetical protein
MTSTMSLFCTFVKNIMGMMQMQAMMSFWAIFGDSFIKKYLMICGLPRTYKLSKVALHTTIQLNTLIHVLPCSFLWVDTSFVLIELESCDGEKKSNVSKTGY